MITSSAPSTGAGRGLGDWIRIIRRRRAIVGGSVLLALAGAGFSIATTPTRYRAEAVVALNVRQVEISPVASIVSDLPQEAPVVRTEIDLISSRMMAEKVMDRLGLADAPASAELWPERPWWASPGGLARAGLRLLISGLRADTDEGEPPPPADPRREIVDRLLSGLRVSNDGRSYTIFIAFTAHDPTFAAEVANAYASAYLDQQVEFQTAGIQNASEWLGSKLESLRSDLQQSELAVEAFRRQAGLTETRGTEPLMQRINALNTEIAVARASRAAAEARLQTARRLAEAGDAEGFAEVLASPVIQSLRRDETEAIRALLQIERFDALKASQIPIIEAQQVETRRRIDQEIGRVLASLASEVEVAARKEQELIGALEEMEAAFAESRRSAVALNQLEREANANRLLYESFLSRYKQTIEQDGLATPEAHLISVATPPKQTASPVLPLIGLALIGGLGGGISLAVVRDHLDRRVRSTLPFEASTGTRVIGLVPKSSRKRRARPAYPLVRDAASPHAFALRRMEMAVRHLRKANGPTVVMVTSANAREGKTAICTGLARYAALAGQRAVVVDANLRAPGAAGPRAGAGAALNDVLNGGASWTSVVVRDPLSPAHVIPARPHTGDTSLLVGSQAFAGLLESLRGSYDLIVIDTPAVLPSPDASAIAAFADVTLLVVRWGVTTIDDVMSALRHLDLSSGAVHAAVLNQVVPAQQDVWETRLTGIAHGDQAGDTASVAGAGETPPRHIHRAGAETHQWKDGVTNGHDRPAVDDYRPARRGTSG